MRLPSLPPTRYAPAAIGAEPQSRVQDVTQFRIPGPPTIWAASPNAPRLAEDQRLVKFLHVCSIVSRAQVRAVNARVAELVLRPGLRKEASWRTWVEKSRLRPGNGLGICPRCGPRPLQRSRDPIGISNLSAPAQCGPVQPKSRLNPTFRYGNTTTNSGVIPGETCAESLLVLKFTTCTLPSLPPTQR